MNKDETDRFWDFVKRTAEEVETWPAWKRNGSGLNLPKRTCNRHDDCDAANQLAKDAGRYAADHCHDDCCSDCFGD